MVFNNSMVMKRFLIIFLFLFGMSSVKGQAQNWSEWMSQKKTQKKYLLQQIAALQAQIGTVKKGYAIAKKGLNAISDLKNGELNLHADYFNSLKMVSPQVKRYSRIAEIISIQTRIIKNYQSLIKKVKNEGAYKLSEIDYMERIFSRMLDDCENILYELLVVTTDGKLELKDDERLSRIDQLYNAMQDNAAFARSFTEEVIGIGQNRDNIKRGIQSSRKRYGINQ